MPRTFTITPQIRATLETWTAVTASDTLLLNAHGMQDRCMLAPPSGVKPGIPDINYAFTVPWDTALFNPFFKNNEKNLYKYVTAFKAKARDFSKSVPKLAIYPFLFDTTWRPTFEWFILRDVCDIAHFSDLEGADYIMLEDLLKQPHWKGGTIGEHYKSILLLTCRSDLSRGVGLGGAKPYHPNGLYKADGLKPHIRLA
jgi:hypothetical protein